MIPRNELIARLLAEHQRIYSHHAAMCDLCRVATAALQEPAEPIAYAVMQDGKCIEATTSRACAERWLPHAPRTIEPLYAAPVVKDDLTTAPGECKPDSEAKDAARYRWIRDVSDADEMMFLANINVRTWDERIDIKLNRA